jgi:hypothetical protein
MHRHQTEELLIYSIKMPKMLKNFPHGRLYLHGRQKRFRAATFKMRKFGVQDYPTLAAADPHFTDKALTKHLLVSIQI